MLSRRLLERPQAFPRRLGIRISNTPPAPGGGTGRFGATRKTPGPAETRLSAACQQPVSSLSAACQQPVSSLSATCQQPVSNLSAACQQPVSSLSAACQQPVSSLSAAPPSDNICSARTEYAADKSMCSSLTISAAGDSKRNSAIVSAGDDSICSLRQYLQLGIVSAVGDSI